MEDFIMRYVKLYQDEDGVWIAEVPSLRGCNSYGDNREHALQNIKEAMEGYIEALEQDNLPVPPEDMVEIDTYEMVAISL